MKICEFMGCDREATETRTQAAVLGGYMCAGEFIATREGNYTWTFCPAHAQNYDQAPEATAAGALAS